METPLSTKAEILEDLWIHYTDAEDFREFVQHNDLGLPLAYAVANNIVPLTDSAKKFIIETFDMLMDMLELEDTGFSNLEQILEVGNE